MRKKTDNHYISDTGRFQLNFNGSPLWDSYNAESSLMEEKPRRLFFCALESGYEQAFNKLKGHFSVIVLDNRNQTTLLLSDKVGVFRFYWSNSNNQLVYADSIREVLQKAKLSSAISPDAVYSYLYFHMIPTPLTIHPEIQKLPPGHLLTFTEGKSVELKDLHIPKFSEEFGLARSEQIIKLHQTLRESTKRAIAGEGFGAFLSGGLDSSTVVGKMASCIEEPVKAYSIGFDQKDYDETTFAKISAEHFGARLTTYYVTPNDVAGVLPDLIKFFDEPFGNSSIVPTYFCAKVAKEDGIGYLLAGDGGDEIFAGNSRYAYQRHFQLYRKIPTILRNFLKAAVFKLPSSVPLANKARSYIRQAKIPLPDRLYAQNYINLHAHMELFQPDFIEQVDFDLPLELLREVYNLPQEASELNRMLFLDWRFTLADNDLRKVSSMCEMAGVEIAFPMLDEQLVDFSCRLPSNLKLKGGELRYFYRQAMKNFLSDATLNKPKHGFGLPFGLWLRDDENLKSIAYDSLSDLKKRGYLRPEFIDRAIDLHQKEHAVYYGELVWLLMVLEIWLSTYSSIGI